MMWHSRGAVHPYTIELRFGAEDCVDRCYDLSGIFSGVDNRLRLCPYEEPPPPDFMLTAVMATLVSHVIIVAFRELPDVCHDPIHQRSTG